MEHKTRLQGRTGPSDREPGRPERLRGITLLRETVLSQSLDLVLRAPGWPPGRCEGGGLCACRIVSECVSEYVSTWF